MLFDVEFYYSTPDHSGYTSTIVSAKDEEEAVVEAGKAFRKRFGKGSQLIFSHIVKHKPNQDEILDKTYEHDKYTYLSIWDPEKTEDEIYQELKTRKIPLYSKASGIPLQALAKEGNIPVEKLLKEDSEYMGKKKGGYLQCTYCKEKVYKVPELENRTCPICGIGKFI